MNEYTPATEPDMLLVGMVLNSCKQLDNLCIYNLKTNQLDVKRTRTEVL